MYGVQVDMKELVGDATQQARWVASDTVEVANLDPPASYTYLYPSSSDTYLFMDNTSFEQVSGQVADTGGGGGVVACLAAAVAYV